MLRRSENVWVSFKESFFFKKGWVEVGVGGRAHRMSKMTAVEYARAQELQRSYPLRLVTIGQRTYWQFQDKFYWDNDGLGPDQVHALLAQIVHDGLA